MSRRKSTKNEKKERDPEMCLTRKGNQYYFGIKCQTGVDAGSGYVHSLETTAANVHDITVASRLHREDDGVAYADAAYLGIEKWEEIARNEHFSAIDYRINRRWGAYRRFRQASLTWRSKSNGTNHRSAPRWSIRY